MEGVWKGFCSAVNLHYVDIEENTIITLNIRPKSYSRRLLNEIVVGERGGGRDAYYASL